MLKRMAKYHPLFQIRLIEKKEYQTIAKQLKGIIKNWE
jgi:hypothetical protein